MHIDKSQALLIYTFLFTHINSEKTEEMFDGESYISLRNFQEELRDFLVGNDVNCNIHHDDVIDDSSDDHCGTCEVCDEDTEANETDSEDEDEPSTTLPEVDVFLTTALLNDLDAVVVTSHTGSKITLEFEDIDEDDVVDVLLDEGSVIIESAVRLKISGKAIEIFDGEEWHAFLVEKKLPKSWRKNIKNDVMYGFKKVEE